MFFLSSISFDKRITIHTIVCHEASCQQSFHHKLQEPFDLVGDRAAGGKEHKQQQNRGRKHSFLNKFLLAFTTFSCVIKNSEIEEKELFFKNFFISFRTSSCVLNYSKIGGKHSFFHIFFFLALRLFHVLLTIAKVGEKAFFFNTCFISFTTILCSYNQQQNRRESTLF